MYTFLQTFLTLTLALHGPSTVTVTAKPQNTQIVVAGSLNLDTFLPLSRLPTEGENLTLLPDTVPTVDVPGGKGCNQAIACAKLVSCGNVKFVGRLGNDEASSCILNEALVENGVDVTHCRVCGSAPCGRGYVFWEKRTGKVSAVVSGGSNAAGWKAWERFVHHDENENHGNGSEEEEMEIITNEYLNQILSIDAETQTTTTKCLLLQREIPEYVNLILARHVQKFNQNVSSNSSSSTDNRILVIQDVGGEDTPMSPELLSLVDYLIPNQSELLRLVRSMRQQSNHNNDDDNDDNHDAADDELDYENIISCAKYLQTTYGTQNILTTLGSKGSILLDSKGNTHIHPASPLPSSHCTVVDETGAGDCYRAAFAVALAEGNKSMRECMHFGSCAGAIAVTREGAVPGIPDREEVEALMFQGTGSGTGIVPRGGGGATVDNDDDDLNNNDHNLNKQIPRGGGAAINDDGDDAGDDHNDFPLMFGSRLNSMKDRPELWNEPSNTVQQWVKRQGTIQGLNCVDFNYPQHFGDWTAEEAKVALEEAGLVAGAVCLRYPKKFDRGAMNHPDDKLRREAIEITKGAAQVARVLGCNEVVVWSAYDGYDYPFQVDYKEKWKQIVEAFQECCDEYPDIKWSLEFKPTDENTRFFTVPSTGAAMLLVQQINRPNMGLTLDVGHMLMAGENPGQSISMVGEKLFGIQLNDGYTRLAAEDGMMFGSIHPSLALEVLYQMQRIDFKGHLYFDTFPQRTDPVKEAEYNIRKVKEFWRAAQKMDGLGIREVMKTHDAIGALNAIDEALRK